MKKHKKKIYFLAILLVILIVFPPLIAPVIHNNDSPKSSIRNYIYKNGYSYQSVFALIQDKNITDNTYGKKYKVLWNDWKSETNSTGTICYAKKTNKNNYNVSCGTGT